MNGNGRITPKNLVKVYPLDPWQDRNLVVCSRCANSMRDTCYEQCQPAHDYHKFVLKEDATFPKVRFADTLTWPAVEKWALTFICAMLGGRG